MKELVFNRGYREKINSIKGLGIGLSLVNKIIESNNGKIWIENRIKGDYTKGSNFFVLFELLNPIVFGEQKNNRKKVEV